LSVSCLRQRSRKSLQLLAVDIACTIGNLFRTADLQPLARLNGFDEQRCLQQGFVRPSIEPGYAASEKLDIQLTTFEIDSIDVRDLILTPRGRPQTCSNVEHGVVIEIQARHSEVRLRLFGLLL